MWLRAATGEVAGRRAIGGSVSVAWLVGAVRCASRSRCVLTVVTWVYCPCLRERVALYAAPQSPREGRQAPMAGLRA